MVDNKQFNYFFDNNKKYEDNPFQLDILTIVMY